MLLRHVFSLTTLCVLTASADKHHVDEHESPQVVSLIQQRTVLEGSEVQPRQVQLPRHGGSRAPASFCVFTRVILQELPYIRSFFQHYTSLGVSKFYVLSNEKHDFARAKVREFLEGIPAQIVLQFRQTTGDEMISGTAMVNEFASLHVTEDFVISVDMDEFWVLPEGVSTLAQLVEARPADLYYAKWQVVVNDKFGKGLPLPLFPHEDNSTKWMARRSALKAVHIHNVELRDANTVVLSGIGFFAHFWCRSFLDSITKGVEQSFVNESTGKREHGSEGPERTLRLLTRGTLPERLRMLALLANAPPQHTFTPPVPLQIDQQLERDVAQRLLGMTEEQLDAKVHAWHSMYLAFKSCVQRVLQVSPFDFTTRYPQRLQWLNAKTCKCGSCP